jgi:hypothetical protein
MTAKKTNPVILGVIAAGVVALLAAGIWLLISAMSASVEESHTPQLSPAAQDRINATCKANAIDGRHYVDCVDALTKIELGAN